MDFTLKKMNPTIQQLESLADQYSKIKINGVEDEEGLKRAKEAKRDLASKRVHIKKTMKEFRQTALDFQKKVIEEEKKILGTFEQTEEFLKLEIQTISDEKEMIKREKALPNRRALLEEKGIVGRTDDEVLQLSFEEFNERVVKKQDEQLQKEREALEEEKKKIEDEKRKIALEKEKEQIRLDEIKKAKEREEILKKENEERVKKAREDKKILEEKNRVLQEKIEQDKKNAIKAQEEAKKKAEEEKQKALEVAKVKAKEEEKERIRLKEAEEIKRKEQEKADRESDARYNEWLKETGYTEGADRLIEEGGSIILYREVSRYDKDDWLTGDKDELFDGFGE